MTGPVRVAWMLVLVGVAGCSPAGSACDVASSQAIAVAGVEATRAGYDLGVYRVASVERQSGRWRVFFEHRPPTPPGGHFTVLVDEASSKGELVHGR